MKKIKKMVIVDMTNNLIFVDKDQGSIYSGIYTYLDYNIDLE